MNKYICKICGYIFKPSEGSRKNQVDMGAPFKKLSKNWKCPECGSNKESFHKVNEGMSK
jgi:rubredoxin